MKLTKLIMVLLAVLLLSGCATTWLVTDMAGNLNASFSKAAQKGTASALIAVKDWPYISGAIRANPEYGLKAPPIAQTIIANLDILAEKREPLTNRECGAYNAMIVRLEIEAGKYFVDQYGVSFYKWSMSLVVGG